MYRRSLSTAVIAGIAGMAGLANVANVQAPQLSPEERDHYAWNMYRRKRAARTRRNIRARASKRRGAA